MDSLGADLATRIGAAAKANDIDYVTHKIAHAALGGAMAAADGKDAASGAIGGVVGEVAAQAFLAEKLKTGISKDDIPALEERGVNLAKLAAGMAAAVAGADVDTAARTGDNAARNNALDTVWDGLCILYDSGKIAYGLYKDDKGMVREGFIDLAADTAAFFIPMVPAGMTKLARAEKAAEAIQAADKAIDAAKIAEGVKSSDKTGDAIRIVEEAAGAKLPEAITGYTRHGINQAISRDGVGVSSSAILDAVKNPVTIAGQSGGRFVFYGKDAVVVLNKYGKVITTWAKSSKGTRLK